MAGIALAIGLTGNQPRAARTITSGPVVHIENGALRGEALANGGCAYRGVPFAAPPVGPLRWRAPERATGWQGIREATHFGPACPQHALTEGSATLATGFSEDCLTLNIWTPPAASPANQQRYPVLVAIHGGALVNGSAAGPVFDGAALARRGIVVVTIQYRLGRFGFFAHPALQTTGDDSCTINFGFLDQIAALQWVQRNIGVFGGDADRVTIMGESAGAMSVLMLMASPLARGLFAAAIAQSPPARIDFVSAEAALKAGEAFTESIGLADASPEALRALPAEALLPGTHFLDRDTPTFAGPAVDGRVAPTTVMAAFANRQQAEVPLLIGATGLEMGAFPDGHVLAVFAQLPEDLQQALNATHDRGNHRPAIDNAADAIGDLAFVEPARAIARLAAAAGQPVWLYRFDMVASHLRATRRGAHHASDVSYAFDTLGQTDSDTNADDLSAAHQWADIFAQFIRTHSPNGKSLPGWPRFNDHEELLHMGTNGAASMADPWQARLDLLDTT